MAKQNTDLDIWGCLGQKTILGLLTCWPHIIRSEADILIEYKCR